MIDLEHKEIWFVAGSQHLYGPETLEQVEEDSQVIAASLSEAEEIPVKIVFKSLVTTSEEIKRVCLEANNAPNCLGVITWMHTFSPAKMWIAGLAVLIKPLLHLHTQFNRHGFHEPESICPRGSRVWFYWFENAHQAEGCCWLLERSRSTGENGGLGTGGFSLG